MCGIAGVFHHGTGTGEVELQTLQRMSAVLAHRGPDGAGAWISGDRRIGLGHRRLAIVEPGPTAAQPLANEDGTVRVTFNGEIYNHAALRQRLTRCGHRFRTDHADTEVIVHAYEEWGLASVEQLDGEFAFAVADETRGLLWLVRDRLGVKPLYFSIHPGLVLFASEIRSLLRHPAVSPAMSTAGLYHYLTFLTTPAPLTMFEGLYKLPAGCTLAIDRCGRITASRYWDALPPDGRWHRELDGLSAAAQEEFCVRGVRDGLDAAIEARTMSDVPFGVLLSGGLDSSSNVALLARRRSAPIRTFTVGYNDRKGINEFDEAREVARLFGTDHHEVHIGEQDALEHLPALCEQQDEPIPDSVCIPLYFVSRLARQTGTPVVQVGEGSDEQFCGYTHYQRYLELHRCARRFRQLPSALQRALATVADAAARMTGRGTFYADAVGRAASDREVFWGGAIGFWERDKKTLLGRQRFADPVARLPDALTPLAAPGLLATDSFPVIGAYRADVERAFPGVDFFTWMTYLECKLRLPELLLLRGDRVTMATSVEARVPFLDHRLVEFVMGIPSSIKIRNGAPKFLLKQAMKGLLPDRIIHREKVGFNAPMATWLRGPFGERVHATLRESELCRDGYVSDGGVRQLLARHRAGQDMSLQLWTLFTVSTWFDRWIAGRPVA